MSANCGKLKNSNYFRHAHKGDFPNFGQKLNAINAMLPVLRLLHKPKMSKDTH